MAPVSLDEVLVPPCPVCDAVRARPAFEIEGLCGHLTICPGCGLGRLHPQPGPDEVRGFYPADYYGHGGHKFESLVELPLRLVAARHLRFLMRGLRPGARVLDVGCGRGIVLSALADQGYETHGVELREEAVRGADPRARIRIAPDLAAAGYPAASFDRIVVWHVLEHLADPRATLAEARRILRPGGQVVVSVPNFGSAQARWAGPAWFHLDPPRHLWHFPVGALRILLEREGFSRRAEHHFSFRQNPFGWLQSAQNMDPSLPRNGLYQLLYAREPGRASPFTAAERARMRLWLLAAPLALGLSVIDALRRDGATVCLVAERTEGRPPR